MEKMKNLLAKRNHYFTLKKKQKKRNEITVTN